MITVLIFIAVLAVLVLSHEFGHFIVARLCGMKVEEFGFGFPPRLFGIRKLDLGNGKFKRHFIWGGKNIQKEVEESKLNHGTVYSINLLPLGGFVKIKGEDGGGANEPDSFSGQAPYKKMLVIVAGVVMNVVLAYVLISIGYIIGTPQISTGEVNKNLTNVRVEILQVLPKQPAEAAGLLPGDAVIKIDNIDYPRLTQMQNYVDENKDKEITFTILRGKNTITKNIHPVVSGETKRGGIGIAIAEVGVERYVWYKALYVGGITTLQNTWQIIKAFYNLLANLFKGLGVGGDVAGPVGVAVLTGQVAKMGFIYLIQFVALLSLNLAVLNILPIPALDGGRFLFLILNKIFKRKGGFKYEPIIHAAGFALLILLVVVITAKDLLALIWH